MSSGIQSRSSGVLGWSPWPPFWWGHPPGGGQSASTTTPEDKEKCLLCRRCWRCVAVSALYLRPNVWCRVGWSDLAFFAIFEKRHFFLPIRYIFMQEFNTKICEFRQSRTAKFYFSKNHRDLKFFFFYNHKLVFYFPKRFLILNLRKKFFWVSLHF